MAKVGLRKALIGDFNTTPGEATVASMVAAGDFKIVDTSEDIEQPTCRPNQGVGRHIDYMIVSPSVHAHRDKQVVGPADHDMVIYEIKVEALEPKMKFNPVAKLGRQTDDHEGDERDCDTTMHDEWTAEVANWWGNYEKAKHCNDVDGMWAILSDAAERMLMPKKEGDHQSVGGRAKPRKLMQIDARGSKATEAGSRHFRLLTKLQRVVTQYRMDFTDTEVYAYQTCEYHRMAP